MESYESRNYHDCDCHEDCEFGKIERILMRNVGRVVTLYLESCGMGGRGFTGLVTKVKDGTVKLVTSIPSAPYEKTNRGRCDGNCDYGLCDHCRNSHFGSAIVIPICKIIAVSVVEI